jgi:hypothetical protein
MTDSRTAEYALRQILRCGIVKASKSSNIAQNTDYTILPNCSKTNVNHEDLILPFQLRIQIENLSKPFADPDPNISSAPVAFLAGYIIKKLNDKNFCNECLSPLVSTVLP